MSTPQELPVPPAQCPECGRFLAKGFVQALVTEPADCPKCGTRLSPANFPDVLGQAAAPDGAVEEPAGAADLREDTMPDAGSVRPPDLDPSDVRATDDRSDPLRGWDQPGADVVELDDFRAGRRPPSDGAIVAGTGLAGAVLGAILARRPVRGVLLGLLGGLLAAATARQVWRLPD